MRITNNIMVNNMMSNIAKNLVRMSKYQDSLATGKKISVPSDDPVVAVRALQLRTDVSEIEQYQRNVEDAQSWMDTTETTLSNVGDVLHRMRELAVQANNGTQTQDDNAKILEEVKQLKTQLVHLANTTYAGRNIFSGFKTDTHLMQDDGTFNIDVDNTENITYEIGIGDSIHVNVLGGDLFNNEGTATSGQKGAFIKHVDDYISALQTQSLTGLQDSIDNIDSEIGNLLRVRADVGARQNRLELSSNRLMSDDINFTKLMSQNEDVDMAETIMKLKNEENVYQASLAGGARIVQPTLMDFLK